MKGFLLTLLIVWIVSRFLKKNVYINTFNSYNQSPPDATAFSKKREGEMSIEKVSKPSKNKKGKDDDGDFIDYEEIK